MEKILFQEEIRYKSWRIPVVLALFGVPLLYIWFRQWTEHTYANNHLIWLMELSGLILLALIGYTVFVLFAQLRVKISDRGIYYQHVPFHREQQHISWDEVEGIQVVKSSEISQFSGWGVHFLSRKNYHSLCGYSGLELSLKNGERVFLGSQKKKKLKKTLTKKIKPMKFA
jgi:hypothetical protein